MNERSIASIKIVNFYFGFSFKYNSLFGHIYIYNAHNILSKYIQYVLLLGYTSILYSYLQVHPILSILEELTHMSSLELDLQRKTKLLGDLKIEMMQLLDEQREKDFDFVKMEEALQMATSQMDHMKGELQNKVCT